MIKRTTSIDISRPVEEVFAFISDPANDGAWRTEVLASELVEGDAGRPGARYRQVMRQGRRETRSTHEIVAVDPPRRVDWRTPEDEGPIAFVGYYACEPVAGGTRFSIHAEVTPRGTARLFQPIMGMFLSNVSKRYARDLKRVMEQKQPPTEEGK